MQVGDVSNLPSAAEAAELVELKKQEDLLELQRAQLVELQKEEEEEKALLQAEPGPVPVPVPEPRVAAAAQPEFLYDVYRIEGTRPGIEGRVIIVKKIYEGDVAKKVGMYTFGAATDKGGRPFEILHDIPENVRRALVKQYPVQFGEELTDFQKAKFEALSVQVSQAFRLKIDKGVPFAWLAFTQTFFIAIMFMPGVRYIGSMYAAVAQIAVVASVLMNNSPYLMTATRVSTAVAIGNVLLAMLAWQSSYDMSEKVAAAFRTAVVVAVGFAMISTGEYMNLVSTPLRWDI